MAKRSYQVNLFNGDCVLDSKSFDADGGNDMEDAGAAAAEIAISMILEAGFLRPGDKIVMTEIER